MWSRRPFWQRAQAFLKRRREKLNAGKRLQVCNSMPLPVPSPQNRTHVIFLWLCVSCWLSVFQRAPAAWKEVEEATPERSGFVKPRKKAGRMRTATRKPAPHSKVHRGPRSNFMFTGKNVSVCTLSLFSEVFHCNKNQMAAWLEIPPLGC